MANVIAAVNRPALVIAHNKTLAAQLYGEFKALFPDNAVEYFVSYYDYYQPEAYIPSTDTYIEKDSAINDEIDKLRHCGNPLSAGPARRHHRRQRLLHLRPRLPRGLPGDAPPPGRREGDPAGRDARPPGRDPVRTERCRFPPRHLPRPRRHRRDLPALRGGEGDPGGALRRHGGGDLRVDPLRGTEAGET